MRLWPRGKNARGSESKVRSASRYALIGTPVVAAGVIALAVSGVLSTSAGFTGRITNDDNHASAGTVSLSETHDGATCTASGDGTWSSCPGINSHVRA